VGARVYRYRVRPEAVERFLEIQRRADALYGQHVQYRQELLQSRDDPAEWLELHWFEDEEAYKAGLARLNENPEIAELFAGFLETLQSPEAAEALYEVR
jgi:hypothetical protein